MKNSKGFTIIEGLLIFVILAIVGGTGWYVYHARNNATDILNAADSANSSVASYAKSQNNTSTTSDWLLYENKSLGFKLSYPKDWKVSEPITVSAANGTNGSSLTIESQTAGDGDAVLSLDIYPVAAQIKDINAAKGDYKISTYKDGDSNQIELVGNIATDYNPSKLLTTVYSSSCWPRACDPKLKNGSSAYIYISALDNSSQKFSDAKYKVDASSQSYKIIVDILKSLSSV